MKFSCCTAVFLLCAGFHVAAAAQSPVPAAPVAHLRGYVVDPHGQYVAGAQVQLNGPASMVTALQTDRYGMFNFYAEEGTYDVVVNSQGYSTLRRDSVLFTRGSVTSFSMGSATVASWEEPDVSRPLRPATSAPPPATVTGSLGETTPFLPEVTSPFAIFKNATPSEYGVLVQGGNGLTENRDGFHFISAGVHAGKVLTPQVGNGLFRGDFEYAMELYPFWQSYTPKFQKASCFAVPTAGTTFVGPGLYCSPLYTVGGTFTGVTMTPIILRWNFTKGKKFMPWAQAAGGLLWTNHKYPAFGSNVLNLNNDGPNADASVWNFTPQGGVGMHYFVKADRSVDFSANAVHISSASLGDKNPGVNASVQFTLGYTWWK